MATTLSQGAVNAPFISRKQIIPSPVFATLVFIITEIMFFVALISAYEVIKARYGAWAPPKGVTLPVVMTGINTGILFLSGVSLFIAARLKKSGADSQKVISFYFWSILLGATFVSVQGYEWFKLLSVGMTFKSEIFASCFYLIIGSHAVHAITAIIAMIFQYQKVKRDKTKLENIQAMLVYWSFIVAVWPFLYALIYFA